MTKKRSLSLIAILTVMVLISVVPVFAADGAAEASGFAGTFWAIVPPVIAIGLALITKEVYSSLFIGILSGALIFSNFTTVISVLAGIFMMGDSFAPVQLIGIVIIMLALDWKLTLMSLILNFPAPFV